MSQISVKNKTLLFVSLIALLSFGTFFYLLWQNQVDKLESIKSQRYQSIKQSYKKNLQKHLKEFYAKQVTSVLTPKVIEAFAQKNRQKLYTLTKDKFEMLKTQDEYLQKMHFHLKNGKSFLRVHKPRLYGDPIAKQRPMVQHIHKNYKPIEGFEVGYSGLSYRVFTPIFFNNNYIGAMEFGANVEKILDIVTYFNNLQGMLNINKKALHSNTDAIHYQLMDNDMNTIIQKALQMQDQYKTIQNKNNYYGVYRFTFKSFTGKELGEFYFFDNLTKEYAFFNKSKITFILIVVTTSILVFFTINYGFNQIISKLEHSYENLKKYMNIVDKNVITVTMDNQSCVTNASEAFSKISGYSKKELIGRHYKITLHQDIDTKLCENISDTIKKDKIWHGEIKSKRKNGSLYWVYATITPRYDVDKKQIGYTAIAQDITDKKRIEELSIKDPLTNTYNRRHFNTIFPKLIEKAKKEQRGICFLMLDIDHFKQYNDNYGHQEGDRVLQAISKAIHRAFQREDDHCFRLGGEEFGVIFFNDDPKNAFSFAQDIRQEILNLEIEHKGNSAANYVSCSIGLICSQPDAIDSIDTIYKRADQKLYEAKRNGRNTVVV